MDADAVRRAWLDRSGEYSPGYYAYYGPNETSEAIRRRLDASAGPEAAVLELGCSSGRHLAHLREHGYRDLHGVEINDEAAAVMAETYPGLAADGTFHFDAIEDVVPGFEDGRFDAVFSVETLQHIHRDSEWVFAEVARIAGDLLVTVEVEGDDDRPTGVDPVVTYVDDGVPLYYRDWGATFTALGLDQVDSEALSRDTLRAFRPDGG